MSENARTAPWFGGLCRILSAVPRLFERLEDRSIERYLTRRGERYGSDPFDRWFSVCPVCKGSYEGHQHAGIGLVFPPCEEFISALENRDWDSAIEQGRGDESELIGHRDLVIARALRCSRERQLVVVVYLSPFALERPDVLLYHEMLDEKATADLEPRLTNWRPALQDRLQSMRETRAEMRRSRRKRGRS